MYTSQELSARIKEIARENNVSIGEMLKCCGLSVNTLANMNNGRSIAFDSLAKIADYLNTSIDELVGRTSHISYGGIKENSFVGQGSGISNTNQFTTNDTLDDDTKEVIRILKSLSPRKRHELIGIIFDFADENM